MATLRISLAVATAAFAFIAAALWLYASWVKVSTEKAQKLRAEKEAKTGVSWRIMIAFNEDEDLEYTLAAQSYWNRWAAGSAGVAAFCQAIYVVVTEFG